MKYITVLLMTMLLASCTNSDYDNFEENGSYWNDEQLLNTDGLELYPFVPFTDKEMSTLSYEIKLEQRQIPEDFLRKMTTKALFYQFVETDLSQSILMFSTAQRGFEAAAKQLNMLPELLNRPDVGNVLLELLKKVDPKKIEKPDCFFWFYCLQIIAAQVEVINRMTDEDINDYIIQQLRCHNVIRKLSTSNKEHWDYPAGAAQILFGLGNVMIRYEFEPFIQTLDRSPVTNELIWDTQYIKEKNALQLIEYIEQFANKNK